MSTQNETVKEEQSQEKSSYITLTVHQSDGTEETHELSYFVGCGIPMNMESNEVVTPAMAMKIGSANVKECMAVNKVLSRQVDPFLLMLEGMIGSSRVVSVDRKAEEEEE